MVYRKRRYSRRRTYKKPMRYKAADMAYKAFKGVRYLKGLVNAELHSFENTASAYINDSGSVVHLTGISQGDLSINRNGNSILSKYLFGRMHFKKDTNAPITFLRVMIVQDKQQVSDTSPVISDILSSVSTISPLNHDSHGRYKILKDMTVRLDSNKLTAAYKINVKLPFHTKFNGTTGADIQKNGVYLVLLSDQSTYTPIVDYSLRFSFYDN